MCVCVCVCVCVCMCVCKLRGNLILVFLKGSWTSGSVCMCVCVCVCDAIDIPFHQCFGYGCCLHACMLVCVCVCVCVWSHLQSQKALACVLCVFLCVFDVCVCVCVCVCVFLTFAVWAVRATVFPSANFCCSCWFNVRLVTAWTNYSPNYPINMYLRSCLLCVCVVTRRAGIKPAGVTRFKHGTETTVMRPTAEKHSETQSLGTNYGVLNLFLLYFLYKNMSRSYFIPI